MNSTLPTVLGFAILLSLSTGCSSRNAPDVDAIVKDIKIAKPFQATVGVIVTCPENDYLDVDDFADAIVDAAMESKAAPKASRNAGEPNLIHVYVGGHGLTTFGQAHPEFRDSNFSNMPTLTMEAVVVLNLPTGTRTALITGAARESGMCGYGVGGQRSFTKNFATKASEDFIRNCLEWATAP